MNTKDLLATLVKALSDAEAGAKKAATLPRKSPKQNLAKAPPKMGRNTGRAQGLIGMTTMVPKRVYKAVVEYCREEQITISYYLRTLIDGALGTDMTGVVAPKRVTRPTKTRAPTHQAKPRQKPGRKPGFGPKPKHSDEELLEFMTLFHKENPAASVQQICGHLRKEYGMRFQTHRASQLFRKFKARNANGKSENIG